MSLPGACAGGVKGSHRVATGRVKSRPPRLTVAHWARMRNSGLFRLTTSTRLVKRSFTVCSLAQGISSRKNVPGFAVIRACWPATSAEA